jgi:putative ABC transport system permease protein
MIGHYFKLALRNIRRHRIYTFINISGLATGMACCLLILLYVQNELKFDKYHDNSDCIYRTVIKEYAQGKWDNHVGSPDLLGPALVEEYPEITQCVRFFHPFWIEKWMVSFNGKSFYEGGVFFADPAVFDVFTFPLIQGDPQTALRELNSIVLTEEMAQKYFYDENPMGKVLSLDGRMDFKVTGIARNVPHNSHFRFDFLVPFEANPHKWAMNNWRTQQFYTYILFTKKPSPRDLNDKLTLFTERHFGKQANLEISLQPLTDIHLRSTNYLYDIASNNSDIAYVYVFSAVAAFILLIACANFMNLTISTSLYRAKELGMRKVIGAKRIQLTKQFLSESLFYSLISLGFAILIVELLGPLLIDLPRRNLLLDGNGLSIGVLLAVTFVVGIVSGSYPSLFLSAFQPLTALKGYTRSKFKGLLFQRSLVILQFTISISLIAGLIAVHKQLRYCMNKDLGFDKEQIVVVPIRDTQAMTSYEAFKNNLLQNPSVVSAAGSSTIPGKNVGSRGILPEGNPWNPRNSMVVDYDFINTYRIDVKEGRNFSREYLSDPEDAYIVNEAAVRDFGWESPIGKRLIWAGDKNKKGFVVGVVKDFHYRSLHRPIEPLVLMLTEDPLSYMSIRVKTQNIIDTIQSLKKSWENCNPGHPFEFFFFDENYSKLYESEKRMGKVIQRFTLLAAFISCLGLFGLASYSAKQRTKEIGIRKVLGASIRRISFMLFKEYTKWIILANILAWPIAYYVMNRWLQNFAYRITVALWMFLLAGASAFIIAVGTVSYQAIKAARVNPTDSLRYE